MSLGVIGVFVVVVLAAIHFVAKWMESRGWIYWTRSRGWPDRAGNAMLEMQKLLEPQKRHVLTVKREKKVERDQSGEPPANEQD